MKLLLSILAILSVVAAKLDQDIEDATFIAYNKSKSIRSILDEYKNAEFNSDLFQQLLTRKELSHLLLSDVENLMKQMESEFPDIISLGSIGKTW